MITYLFGAGASAQAVPVVKDIPGDIDALIGKLYDPTYYHPSEVFFSQIWQRWFLDQNEHSPFNDDFNSLIYNDVNFPSRGGIAQILLKLKDEIGSSASIDTVAKRLFMVDKEKFIWYKKAIVLWLTLTQRLNKPDPRYELFLATVMNSMEDGLPSDKINLLSWNYDMQFEMAFSSFLKGSKNLTEAASQIGITSRTIGHQDNRMLPNKERILFKINGSACQNNFADKRGFNFLGNSFSEPCLKPFLNEVWENFGKWKGVDLSFAWEEDTFPNEEFERFLIRLKKSRALVIIGYSFPTFNRKIDKRIFEGMHSQRIYIQDKSPEAIADKLNMNFRIGIPYIKTLDPSNLGEFFIPPEYDS